MKVKKFSKRAFAVLLTVLLMFSAFPICAGAVEDTSSFEYEVLEDGTAEITGYHGSESSLNIPSEIDGYKVTSIGWHAFSNCTSLASVTIPDSVTSIKGGAFSGCTSLASVTIPDSVTSIKGGAFSGCTSLTSITIPDSVTSIGNYTFSDCTSLASVTIPDSVTSIGSGAFSNTAWYDNQSDGVVYAGKVAYKYKGKMPKNTSIKLKDGTKSIVDYAFRNCTNLVSVTIPDSVTSIGESTFSQCTSLTSVTIPDSVTSIGESTFWKCTSLTSVTIPDSVTSIGESTFWKCTSLTSVTIPDSVTSIGQSAFNDCTSLTSITIPNSVTSIGHSAFSGCTSLTGVTIPNSVTRVDWYAFSDCTNLKNIKLPNGTASIGNWVFRNCTALENITVPSGIEFDWDSIDGFSTFDGCTNLKNINVSQSNENYSSYDGTLLDKDGYSIICCPAGKSGNYIIPNTVGRINNYAFENCNKLTDITIPESVSRIDKYAFRNCSGLTKIIIPENATVLGYYGGWYEPDGIFVGCTNLEEIEVDINNSSYSSLDGVLFNKGKTKLYYCPAQKRGEYNVPENTEVIVSDAFYDCTALKKVVIPSNVSFSDYTFNNCTDLERIEIAGDNTKYSSVDGVLLNKDKTEILFCPRGRNGDYIIPDGIQSIDSSAFSNCSKLESITISESVSDICKYYDHAFVGCTNLSSINVDEKNVNYASVYGVLFNKDETNLIKYPSQKTLQEYSIPNSVTYIAHYAFCNCTNLTNVTIPDNVTEIGGDVFSGCTSLTNVIIPDSVTSIGDSAFSGCTSLTSVTIPNSVTEIYSYVFSSCTSLTNVTIPDSVTWIGRGAFIGCTSLTNVTIPDSVKRIDSSAFRACTSLTSVTIPDSVTEIDDYAFGYSNDNDKVKDFTIYGTTGSMAENYSQDNGFIFIDVNPVEHKDDSTGISVTAKADADADLTVSEITDEQSISNANTLLGGAETVKNLYDISLTKDGEKVQHEGMAEVKIPCENENAKVYRVESDNTLTDMNAVYTDGNLVFHTEHFSLYIVAEQSDKMFGDINTDGKVDVTDVTALQNLLAKSADTLNDPDLDLNSDGKIDVADVTYLQQYLAGTFVKL